MKRCYARVSTEEQSLERQLLTFKEAFGGEVYQMYEEKRTAKGSAVRPVLEKLIADLEAGDEVVTDAVDRIGRSVKDFMDNIFKIQSKKASLYILNLRMRFDENPFAKAMIQLLMVFAELERSMISERTKDGLKQAKAEGKFKGRKPRITDQEIQFILEKRKKGWTLDKISKAVKVSNCGVFKAIQRYERGEFNLNKEYWMEKNRDQMEILKK